LDRGRSDEVVRMTAVDDADPEGRTLEHVAHGEPEIRRGLPEPRRAEPVRRVFPLRSLIVGVGLGVALVWGYTQLTSKGEHGAVAEKVPKVIRQGYRITVPEGSPLRSYLAVEPVREETVQRRLLSPAVVEPDPAHLVKVLPPIAGRVTQLNVSLGDAVKQGQPLLVIDSSDLSSAFADDHKARVGLELARRNMTRMTALKEAQAASERDVEQARTDFGVAQAEYDRTQTRLKQLGVSASRPGTRELVIVAPQDGRVIDLTAARGAVWNDSTAPMMTIADLRTIWVTANLPEKDGYLIARGERVEAELTAYPGVTYYGKVHSIGDVLDPDTRRIKARIEFDNPGERLKPGMFANVTFLSVAEKTPVVPTSALLLLREKTQVYVEVEPWVFVPREVEPAYQSGDITAIRRGLEPGTRVIARGGVLLND
jgi:cobalt-zinc-cadmium efflux system membrane fusion protein